MTKPPPENLARRVEWVDADRLFELPPRYRQLADEYGVLVPLREIRRLTRKVGEEEAYKSCLRAAQLHRSRTAFEEYGPDHPDAKAWNERREEIEEFKRAHLARARTIVDGIIAAVDQANRERLAEQLEREAEWERQRPERERLLAAKHEARTAEREIAHKAWMAAKARNRAEIARRGLAPPLKLSDGRSLAVRRISDPTELRVVRGDQIRSRRGLVDLLGASPLAEWEVGHAAGRGGAKSLETFEIWNGQKG